MRFLNTFQDEATDADSRFLRVDLLDFEEPFGVVIPKLIAKLVAALGNGANAAPLAVADLKTWFTEILERRDCPPAPHDTRDTGTLHLATPSSSCRQSSIRLAEYQSVQIR